MGMDYEIQYKKETENKVANTLLRKVELNVISIVTLMWIQEVTNSYIGDVNAQQHIQSASCIERDKVITLTIMGCYIVKTKSTLLKHKQWRN